MYKYKEKFKIHNTESLLKYNVLHDWDRFIEEESEFNFWKMWLKFKKKLALAVFLNFLIFTL